MDTRGETTSAGAIAVDQAALTLLMVPDGVEQEIGGQVVVAGYDPADRAGYVRWQREIMATVLRMQRLINAAERAGRPRPPLLPAPVRPREAHEGGATALLTEPVLLAGAESDVDADLSDILSERVTLVNAPSALVDLAMSLAGPGVDPDAPAAVAALQVWAASAHAEGEWYSRLYGALVDPGVEYVDHGGTRRATLSWTALEWAGFVELPYGEQVTVEPENAALCVSGTRDIPPPPVPRPALLSA